MRTGSLRSEFDNLAWEVNNLQSVIDSRNQQLDRKTAEAESLQAQLDELLANRAEVERLATLLLAGIRNHTTILDEKLREAEGLLEERDAEILAKDAEIGALRAQLSRFTQSRSRSPSDSVGNHRPRINYHQRIRSLHRSRRTDHY